MEQNKAPQTVRSHSERHILEGCLFLMNEVLDEIRELLQLGWTPDEIFSPDDREGYYYSCTWAMTEIVRELFLSNTAHSGMTSCTQKCRELGVNPDERMLFIIDEQDFDSTTTAELIKQEEAQA